ncbi:MAG: hypothetical protein E7005_02825 [Alphaproteobacteria bacterium]|nr:hypothetical protein [Alphaproteobacteria bacterium]
MEYISKKDELLAKIDSCLNAGLYSKARMYISDYKASYGELDPTKKFSYVYSFNGDSVNCSKSLSDEQTLLTEVFLLEVAKGEITELTALAYEYDYRLHEMLLKAFEEGDVLRFHMLITELNARPDFVYTDSNRRRFTLWEKIKFRKNSDFYKYFVKHCNDLPDVKEHLDNVAKLKALIG